MSVHVSSLPPSPPPGRNENRCGCRPTFLPEDVRAPGQHGLQQHGHVSLWVITAQVVLQLSVVAKGEEREINQQGYTKYQDVNLLMIRPSNINTHA